MKIIHTADLHLGQLLYQNYERGDEHEFFFRQLEEWCREERPDVLLLSGDVFDIHQPSARVRQVFSEAVASLRHAVPGMTVVIIAGNHDSASRIQSDNAMWRLSGAHLIGLPPSSNYCDTPGWEDDYIIRLDNGWVAAIPFMSGDRTEIYQAVLDRIGELNREASLPVVMMAHLTVNSSDTEGHDFDIGMVKSVELEQLGEGYDYLALGHIHKSQTLGHPEDRMKESVSYPSPVARYAGSPLHVSCDEAYPHSVSLVEIDTRCGDVTIRQLRVNQLRHFITLPKEGEPYTSSQEALDGVKKIAKEIEKSTVEDKGRYIRLRVSRDTILDADFNQRVYDIAEPLAGELRYNPRIIREGEEEIKETEARDTIKVTELQDMSYDPIQFVERTFDNYSDLGLELKDIREMFAEVKNYMEGKES